MSTGHVLHKPTWLCGCGSPWPCQVRREELLEEFGDEGRHLRALMMSFFHDAITNPPPGLKDPKRLATQILEWIPGSEST